MTDLNRTIQRLDFENPCAECYIHEEKLYAYIENYAREHALTQTQKILPFAREQHAGQIRKGEKNIPYIYHPLMAAYHAIALGIEEDDIISTAILHDVCEDCGVAPADLPVNEATRAAVVLLTKSEEISSRKYYNRISENKIATVVKLLDRCNNVSDMTKGFSKEKIKTYIAGTEEYVYPLLQHAKKSYSEYAEELFLLEYHMVSVITSVKNLL